MSTANPMSLAINPALAAASTAYFTSDASNLSRLYCHLSDKPPTYRELKKDGYKIPLKFEDEQVMALAKAGHTKLAEELSYELYAETGSLPAIGKGVAKAFSKVLRGDTTPNQTLFFNKTFKEGLEAHSIKALKLRAKAVKALEETYASTLNNAANNTVTQTHGKVANALLKA